MSIYLSEKHRAAREYAAAGIRIFPCRAGDKKPAVNHWNVVATTDAAQIDAWWTENPQYNPATSPDWQDCIVVDLDPKGEAEWLARGQDLNTCRNRTPRGGWHLWFHNDGKPLGNSASRYGIDIDIRGEGGYVLLPPSHTSRSVNPAYADGDYVEASDDRDCATFPADVRNVLTSGKSVERSASAAPDDLPSNVASARRFLSDDIRYNGAPIVGQGSDARTIRIACRLLDMAISPELSGTLLKEIWSPDFDEDWLALKVENAVAYRQNKGTPDAALPAAEVFKGLALDKLKAENAAQPEDEDKEWPQEIRPKRFKGSGLITVSGTEYAARPYPPLAELASGWIEKCVVTYLEGPGKTNKSRMALQDSVCLGAGLPIFGEKTEQCETLYLNYENPDEEMTRRFHDMRSGLREHGNQPLIDVSNIHVVGLRSAFCPMLVMTDKGKLLIERFGDRVLEWLRRRKDQGLHTFVVFDGMMDAIVFQGSTRSEDGAVTQVIRQLDEWARELDFSAYAILHPSRAGERQQLQGGSYAAAFFNKPRAIQAVRRLDADDGEKERRAHSLPVDRRIYTRTVVARSHGLEGTTIALEWRAGCLQPIGVLQPLPKKPR